jgi:chromosome segregation ATPase
MVAAGRADEDEAAMPVMPVQWRNDAAQNLWDAKFAHDAAEESHTLSEEAQGHVQMRRHQKMQGTMAELAAKVAATRRMLEKLGDRKAGLEESIGKIERYQLKLLQAEEAVKSPLELCDWRIKQRSGRPSGELVHDDAEIALEEEMTNLTQSRKQLQEMRNAVERVLRGLKETLEEVQSDIAAKTESRQIDEACWRSLPGYLRYEPVKKSKDFEGGRQVQDAPCNPEEKARREATWSLVKKAQKRENVAAAVLEKTWVLMRETESRSRALTTKSERALADRLRELNQAKALLQKRIVECQSKIDKTKLELQRVHWEVSNHEDPLGTTKGVWEKRKQHPGQERIDDDPKAALQDHLHSLKLNKLDLQARAREDEDAVRSLQEALDTLQADLNAKQSAFVIDSSCLHAPYDGLKDSMHQSMNSSRSDWTALPQLTKSGSGSPLNRSGIHFWALSSPTSPGKGVPRKQLADMSDTRPLDATR